MWIIIWIFLHWACKFGLECLLIIHLILKTKKQPSGAPTRNGSPAGAGAGTKTIPQRGRGRENIPPSPTRPVSIPTHLFHSPSSLTPLYFPQQPTPLPDSPSRPISPSLPSSSPSSHTHHHHHITRLSLTYPSTLHDSPLSPSIIITIINLSLSLSLTHQPPAASSLGSFHASVASPSAAASSPSPHDHQPHILVVIFSNIVFFLVYFFWHELFRYFMCFNLQYVWVILCT